VFVGNLSYDTSQRDLEALFSEVGEVVEVFLPADRATGRPRGFAFVELADESAAAEAIEKFDGHDLGGRALRVTEAEDRPRRSGFSDPGGGDSPSGPPRGAKKSRPKGSRRNIRGRKRSL
jgi:cold-inducible RNA-binding protein